MRRLRTLGLGLLGLVILAALWELYKVTGPENGVVLADRAILPRTGDRAMPHLWDMGSRLFEPATGRRGDPLWVAVLQASWFSLRIAAAGWLIGVIVGLLLALGMQRIRLAEASVLPWVVLSQTVPLIAIAPLVRRWGSQISIGSFEWESATRWRSLPPTWPSSPWRSACCAA